MASTYTIAGIALGPNGPVNGATVYAWKAQRFSAAPSQNGAAPTGSADAGPVTSGTSFGSPGAYQIACPTNEPYYIACTYSGVTYWSYVNDLNFTDYVETTVGSSSNGQQIGSLTSSQLYVASNSGLSAPGRVNVTTSGGQAILAFTGVSGGTLLTGITVVSGTTTWTVSTGAAVTSTEQIQTLNQTLDDGSGDASFAGIVTPTGGTNNAAAAAVSTPSFVSGTAQQLSTTKNGFLYIDVTTAASLTIAIGPTSSPANTLQSAVVGGLGLETVFVPAGWYVKLTGTMADLAFKFITC